MELQMKGAYKIKSTSVDAKKLRLHRRSLDWKKNRHEEASKGRNLQNLSPLQEISCNDNVTSSYQGKTPVKWDAAEVNGKKRKLRTADDVKRELVKWKKEKELKKKLEKEKQKLKPSFKVFHMAHNDNELYKKDSKKGKQICPVAGFVSTQTKTKSLKPGIVESRVSTKNTAVKTVNKRPETSKSKSTAPAPVVGRVTRSQTASKGAKSSTISSNTSRPSAKTRTSEKQKASASSKQPNSATEKKTTAKEKPSNLNLEKVSTFRGISFAPEDFTFSAPSNISTFEFKPLSPASTARFLCPATTSFIGTDPKRCSTPKPDPSQEVEDSDCMRETSQDILAQPQVNTEKPTMQTDVSIHLGETRRVTRSLRRSILGTQSATPTTEVCEQSSGQYSVKTSEVDMIEAPASVQESDNEGISTAPRELTLLKESLTPLNTQKEAKSIPKRMTRSLRRSLCLSPPSETLTSPKKVLTPRSTRGKSQRSVMAPPDEVMVAKPLDDEVFSNSPTKEDNTDTNQTPERRNNRRTMSNLAPFAQPNSDCLVLSASRSKRKRRKTQHDRPVNPKSPEEWVSLLKNSPMVEMNRRKPKTKTMEPLLMLDLDMDFDGDLETSQKAVNDSTSEVTSSSLVDEHIPLSSGEMSDGSAPTTTDQAILSPGKDLTDAVPSEQLAISQPKEAISSEPEEHNVKYFRNLMSKETDIFNGYCSKWEDINNDNPGLSEEVEGQIRTCIGQAQLLMSQRFKQFTGLVDNCEFRTGEKETTLTDLQGFWDMIYYQVEDVHTKFADLEKLKANNWVDDKPKIKKKIIKKKVSAKPAVKRPPVVSKFAAFRAQMKNKKTAPDIICHEEPVVTFDGGFFKVASPKKTPKFHCEAGSPQRNLSTTSTEKEKVSESKSTPLLEVASPAVESLGLTSLRTPSRKSYVPVNPSPLLRDITPKVTSTSRPARHSLSKRLCSGMEAEAEVHNKENEMDDNFSNDTAVKKVEIPVVKNISTATGTPRAKVTPRRSLRSRRSICEDSSPSSVVQDTDKSNDFFKYLQPSNVTVSKAPCDSSALDNDDDEVWDLSSALSATETTDKVIKNSPVIPKRRTSSLKQLPSSQRRRSTRRSVHFSASPAQENAEVVEDVISVPDRVGDDMLIFTPPGQQSLMHLGDDSYLNQNAGATPACRNARPSLLFTPPKDSSTVTANTTTHTEIPTDILISFTP
ncbi:disks large-associated protein 5-like [Ylistrum balloti]|uniref:disks large-associated protein 5-like n=1 Tax=Ylistrum balloti TaxID=509963 RepID=UPI002905DB44|nr:disks large-associated protein 5-like [Ylistrum balloti]